MSSRRRKVCAARGRGPDVSASGVTSGAVNRRVRSSGVGPGSDNGDSAPPDPANAYYRLEVLVRCQAQHRRSLLPPPDFLGGCAGIEGTDVWLVPQVIRDHGVHANAVCRPNFAPRHSCRTAVTSCRGTGATRTGRWGRCCAPGAPTMRHSAVPPPCTRSPSSRSRWTVGRSPTPPACTRSRAPPGARSTSYTKTNGFPTRPRGCSVISANSTWSASDRRTARTTGSTP